MTTIIIPKQPTHLKYCDLCQCLGVHCTTSQLAQFDDNFSFQIQDNEIFLGEELFTNLAGTWLGDFEDPVAGIIGASGWQNDGSGTNAWARSNVAPLAGTWSARVQLDSDIISNTETLSGKFSIGDRVRLKVLHSAIEVDCDLEIYYSIGAGFVLLTTISGAADEETFIYDFVNTFGDITGFGFKYTVGCEGEGYRAIDNVSVKVYDFSKFKIFDCCDSEQKGVLDSTKFTVSESYITFEDLWSNYVSDIGLYKICIDDIDLIKNGNFEFNLDNWDQSSTGTTWNYSAAETAALVLTTGTTSKEIYQEINLPSKCPFDLTFEADVSLIADVTISVYVNHIEYETYTFAATTLNQTTTITSKKPITSIGFVYQNDNANTINADVDKITLVTDICSDCFDLATEHDCSILLESTNSHDAFGFEFDDFTMYQRLYSDLFKYSPEYDQLNNRSSAGINTQVYGDLQSIFEFKVYRIPGYLMDAILIMIIMNTVYLDGEQYIKNEGSVELDWDRLREFAAAVIEMKLLTENNQNTYS